MDSLSSEQLNFFRFSTVVLEEFPAALRQVFVYMWDNFSSSRLYPAKKWDDSEEVRNLFSNEEGKTKAPTNKSYEKWGCSDLLEATLFAKAFGEPDARGNRCPLNQLYVKRRLSPGVFHTSVQRGSLFRRQPETFALALDQLRLLRNTLCYHTSTQTIDADSFDRYISLTMDAFAALNKQDSTRVTAVKNLKEEHFPSNRRQQLEEELRRERDAAIMFGQMEDSQDGLTKSQVHNAESRKRYSSSNVEHVESDLNYIRSGVTDKETKLEDAKHVNSGVTDAESDVVPDVKASVRDVGPNVKVVKNGGKDVRTNAEDVESAVNEVSTHLPPAVVTEWAKVDNIVSGLKHGGSNVNDVETGGDSVMQKDEDVESDNRGVNTGTTEGEAQVENIGTNLKPGAKTGQIDVQPNVKDAKSEENMKQGKTDAHGNYENVRSHVTSVKIGATDTKINVQEAEKDVKNYVKTKLKNSQLAMINKNFKHEVKEHKTKREYPELVGELCQTRAKNRENCIAG